MYPIYNVSCNFLGKGNLESTTDVEEKALAEVVYKELKGKRLLQKGTTLPQVLHCIDDIDADGLLEVNMEKLTPLLASDKTSGQPLISDIRP
jgi:hypothetical protein